MDMCLINRTETETFVAYGRGLFTRHNGELKDKRWTQTSGHKVLGLPDFKPDNDELDDAYRKMLDAED